MQAGKGALQLPGTDPVRGRAAADGGAGWPLGVEQDEAMTQPSPGLSHTPICPLSPSFPGKAPVAPGDPGVQPGMGPHVCVSAAEIGASR